MPLDFIEIAEQLNLGRVVDSTLTPCGSCSRRLMVHQRWSLGNPDEILCHGCYLVASNPPVFYGTQPAVLPETLPIGTRTLTPEGASVTGSTELRIHCGDSYIAEWKTGHARDLLGLAHASLIDWSTVPIQGANGRCAVALYDSTCCHLAGHDGHHESAGAGNRLGWVDGARPSGVPIAITICASDTPSVIARNFEEVVAGNATRAQKPTELPRIRDPYTEHRLKEQPDETQWQDSERHVAARARMNTADRRDAPKSTASSRELAKPHPWGAWATPGSES